MQQPVKSAEAYIEYNGTVLPFRSGNVDVVYARADTNDSEDGNHDHSELTRRHIEVNAEFLASKTFDPHGGPYQMATSARDPVSFKWYDYPGANPYECELSVDRFTTTGNAQDSSSMLIKRLVGRSVGTVLLPGET